MATDDAIRMLRDRLDRALVAGKTLKLEVERATRILWTNPIAAEKILLAALKQAEQDGI